MANVFYSNYAPLFTAHWLATRQGWHFEQRGSVTLAWGQPTAKTYGLIIAADRCLGVVRYKEAVVPRTARDLYGEAWDEYEHDPNTLIVPGEAAAWEVGDCNGLIASKPTLEEALTAWREVLRGRLNQLQLALEALDECGDFA